MIIVGLTGGIGSGKTTVAKYFQKSKIPIFDSDKEVKDLYKEKNTKLIKIIKKIDVKNEIIKKNKINKKILGDIVFNNAKKLKALESCIFKILKKKRIIFLKKNKNLKKKVVVLDTPLLFENNIDVLCDYIVVTKATLKTRTNRVLKRKNMTTSKLKNIIANQMPEKTKINRADFVVQTNKGKWYTSKKVKNIIKTILKENKLVK